MADGYIAGIIVPDTTALVPQIGSGCQLQVTEYLASGALPTSMSAGRASITYLDVISGHLYGMIIEEREHTTWPTADPWIPTNWDLKGQHAIDRDVGNDYSELASVPGITANLSGSGSTKVGVFHDFRIAFLNADNVKAIIAGETEVLGSFTGNVFTRTSGTWAANEYLGRIATFKNGTTTVLRRPIYAMTTTTLTVKLDGVGVGTVDRVEIENDVWVYDIGAGGLGQEFNGINDFEEFAEALGLEIDKSGNGTYNTTGGTLTGLVARLRWQNMYNHAAISNHPHADGINRDTTQEQWASISTYVIFVYQDTDPSDPGPVDGNYPNPDETKGTWYMAQEILAPHIPAGTLAYIEATVVCPQGSQLAFWVGAKTGATESAAEKIAKGLPPQQPAS